MGWETDQCNYDYIVESSKGCKSHVYVENSYRHFEFKEVYIYIQLTELISSLVWIV